MQIFRLHNEEAFIQPRGQHTQEIQPLGLVSIRQEVCRVQRFWEPKKDIGLVLDDLKDQ